MDAAGARTSRFALACVQKPDRLQNHIPDDLHTLRAELVDGVLRRVVEDIAVAVLEIDKVRRRDTQLYEGQVVVFNGRRPIVEV